MLSHSRKGAKNTKEIFEKIPLLTDLELQEIMAAIQKRYGAEFPDWDVLYLAVHKDPALRKAEMEYHLNLLCKSLHWKVTLDCTDV